MGFKLSVLGRKQDDKHQSKVLIIGIILKSILVL